MCSSVPLGLVFTSCGPGGGRALQPQSGRLKPPGPAPGDSGVRPQADGLPSRPRGRAARDFSADAAQDAVILSVQDLAAAQEAVDLDRQDQEDERRTWGAAAAGDRPDQGAGSAGRGTPGPRTPPAAPPASPPAGRTPPQSPPAGGPAAGGPAPAEAGPGGLARRGPGPGGRRRPAAPPPPWSTVLLTTVRLWAQRRQHLRWPAQARWRVLTLLVVAAVLFAAGAISIALTSSPAPAGHARGGGTQAAAWPGAHSRRHPGGRGGPHGRGTLDRRRRFPRPRSCRATRRCARSCRPTGSRRRSCSRWAGAIPPRWAAI